MNLYSNNVSTEAIQFHQRFVYLNFRSNFVSRSLCFLLIRLTIYLTDKYQNVQSQLIFREFSTQHNFKLP